MIEAKILLNGDVEKAFTTFVLIRGKGIRKGDCGDNRKVHHA